MVMNTALEELLTCGFLQEFKFLKFFQQNLCNDELGGLSLRKSHPLINTIS